MGLGSTAKKLQKLSDVAEKLYSRMNDLRQQVEQTRGTVEETGDRVGELDRRVREQRAIVEALAEEQGIDTDAVVAEAVIEEAEDTEETAGKTEEAESPQGDAVTTDD